MELRAEALASPIERYERLRRRSEQLFGLLNDEAYYSRPIELRHPVVFYEGHLPAFSFNTLVRRALGGASIDPVLERLFARGIDPHEKTAGSGEHAEWPSRATVRAFAEEADRRVLQALAHEDLDRPGHPLLDHAEAAFTILEHEAMHHETLLYIWQRLPFDQKQPPAGYAPRLDGAIPEQEWVEVPPGTATLGVNRGAIPFGWDNEFPALRLAVPGFAIGRHNVTNASYLEFVEAGGYREERWWRPEDWEWIQGEQISQPRFWERTGHEWSWRGMFARVPLPLSWPVYVSQAEARAYAAWRGLRLPTEAEFQRAAYGTHGAERQYPWGDAPPTPAHGVFDFSSWDPEPAGAHPAGASSWGVEDLVGNGWEWTSTPFMGFPGFQPMASYPEYSADFFDGEHFVLKGASPATAAELIRPTFRNWFRARYPFVYASFRCVNDVE
jgi:ergothioneine biosynthesis protein EgtB